MSALDDLIARDSAAPSVNPLDALIARDAGASPAAPTAPNAPAPINATPGEAPPTNWQPPGSLLMGIGDAIGGGLQSAIHGGAWLANKIAPDSQFAKDITAAAPQIDQTIQSHDSQYSATRAAAGQTGFDAGRTAGNLIGAAPFMVAAPEAAALSLPAKIGMGATLGAAGSALTPITDSTQPYGDQKLFQTLAGGAFGGAAPVAAAALGKAVSGVGGAAQQRLSAAGVQMTPGQIMGGMLGRTEDKLTSVPVLGDLIKNAQQRSVQSLNRATYNDALAPVGQALPSNVSTGSDAVGAVANKIGAVYDSIAPRATFVSDTNFGNDVAQIRNDLSQTAPGMLPQFDNVVNNQITAKLNNGVMTGDQWGNTRSTINSMARSRLMGNASPDDRELSGALDSLGTAVNSAVGRSSPPDVLATLNQANSAWARYKQIEKAAGSVGASNNGNIFSPAQYAAAIRGGSTAAQKGRNGGLNAGFAADAQQVLGSKYPDSGSIGRALAATGAAAVGGHAFAPQVMLPAALGLGAASVPYLPFVSRGIQGALMSRPAGAQALGHALSNYGGALAPAFAMPFINGLNP